MQARVVKEYIDRNTQEFHAVGDVVSLTDERFLEITRAGRYVEEVIQEEAPVNKAENPDSNLDQNPANQDPIGQNADPADHDPADEAADPADYDSAGEAADPEDQDLVGSPGPNKMSKNPRRKKK